MHAFNQTNYDFTSYKDKRSRKIKLTVKVDGNTIVFTTIDDLYLIISIGTQIVPVSDKFTQISITVVIVRILCIPLYVLKCYSFEIFMTLCFLGIVKYPIFFLVLF